MTTPIRKVVDPFLEFVRLEVAGGLVLLAATVAALAWANSPWREGYERVADSGHDVVNDGLMTVFFLVVGLEIKRELVAGELRDPRVAALPAIAALGGMVTPALLYTLFNAGGPGAKGWGIPMATDIAFAVGVVAVLGRRVPAPLKVFLLSLAVADDIGAILVIAVFYTSGLHPGWLSASIGGLVVIAALRRAPVPQLAVYVALGTAVWFATHESGVHPTIAGVALGLLAPPDPVAGRLEHALHPWTSFLVIPVFALVNAGVDLRRASLGAVLEAPVGRGILVGLVAGKVVGITAASWLAVRLGLASLPRGVRWLQMTGVSAVAGIGFTVSLFIIGLAFPDPGGPLRGHPVPRQSSAKLAVLAASAVAAILGSALLLVASARRLEAPSASGTVTDS